jgi:hypothetical protein
MKLIAPTLLIIAGYAGHAQSLYGGFESWRNYHAFGVPSVTLEAPSYWYSTDSLTFFAKGLFPTANFKRQVFKTTDAHSGTYAAKLMTLSEDTFGILPGLLTNAEISINPLGFDPNNPIASTMFTGGTSINSQVPAISARVKYFPKGNDTAYIIVYALKSGFGSAGTDSVVGNGLLAIYGQVNSYTKMTVNINYADTIKPDLLQILIVSSGLNGPQDSSTLCVDDVIIEGTSVKEIQPINGFAVYPNPVRKSLHVEGEGITNIHIYNSLGQLVYNTNRTNHTIDVSAFKAGIYYVEATGDNGGKSVNNITKQ